jgi:threonyl-tRNA synthetase
MLIVGPKDAEGGAVSVRSRDKGELGAMPFDQLVALLEGESKSPR